eukprot:PITA_02134
MMDSALKHSSWRMLLEKLEARLSSWTHRALNMANRLVLIKAVLQSMPLYLFLILATPKLVLKDIKRLQRSFLWGNSEQKRKWTLVKWDTVFLPKLVGGMSLCDPYHSNVVMGTRIWWKWLTLPSTPWAYLWTAKYANSRPTEELIQISEVNPGHRQWCSIDHILRQGTESAQQILGTELAKRRIQYSDEKDILRWGYEEKGTFTTREAYHIIVKEHTIKDPLWNKIWDPKIWLKFLTFLWLLCQNKILTWDNLRKRSFHGPSICPNCKQEEETTQHLMNYCPLAHKLWEKVSFRYQKDGWTHGDIVSIARNWARNPFKSKLLNSLWKLILGFLMWTIWKERN